MKLLVPISNRATPSGSLTAWELPADDWYQIAPVGEYAHTGAGIVQVLDGVAITSMANRATTPANIRIDYDHFSYDPNQSSEAAGWITELQARADGLYGKVRWTPDGRSAVANGNYRFISPVWLQSDMEPVAMDGSAVSPRQRPLRLDSAGLTNNPNLRGMTPLSNRANGDQALPEPGANTNQKPQTTEPNQMKSVLIALGLAETATETHAVEAVNALKNRATALEGENKGLLAAQVDADLDRFKAVIDPAKRDTIKAQLLANRAGTLAILESIPASAPAPADGKHPAPGAGASGAIHNRSMAKTPVAGVQPEGGDNSVAQTNAVRAVQNRQPGMKFEQAWAIAKQEKPELWATVSEPATSAQ